MRKILWLKQSFHIPYDMNLLIKLFQFIYESLFVDKKYKIQPLRLSQDLILQEPKVLGRHACGHGDKGTGPHQVLEATCAPEQYCSRMIVSKVQIFWEGHKILRNLPLTFDYSTYSQK